MKRILKFTAVVVLILCLGCGIVYIASPILRLHVSMAADTLALRFKAPSYVRDEVLIPRHKELLYRIESVLVTAHSQAEREASLASALLPKSVLAVAAGPSDSAQKFCYRASPFEGWRYSRWGRVGFGALWHEEKEVPVAFIFGTRNEISFTVFIADSGK